MCFFTAESVLNKHKFMAQLNVSFGCGAMSSSLEHASLTEYFQFVQRSGSGPLEHKKGVLTTGRQANGVWVINQDTFISGNGRELSKDDPDHGLVWLNKDIIYESDKISCADISPQIKHPLSTDSLLNLVDIYEKIGKHNFIPTLLVMARTVLSFHYECIVEMYGGCPITVAVGDPETGKSTALRAGLSIFGGDDSSKFVRATNAALLERSSRSSLPYGIEEAASGRKGNSRANRFDFAELVVDLFNGSKSTNLKTGSVKPKSIPIVASNFDVDNVARFVVIVYTETVYIYRHIVMLLVMDEGWMS